MSIYPTPSELISSMKDMEANLEKFTRDIHALIPEAFFGPPNLMAHPMAATAAAAALGTSMASQAFGLWMGSVSTSMEAAARLASQPLPFVDVASSEWVSPQKRNPAPARATAPVPSPDPGPVAEEAAEAVEAGATMTAAEPAASVETLVAVTPTMPAPIERPGVVDDLKAISGVGPKLENVLNGLGIWTYAQVAAFGEGEVSWLDDHLGFRGRIVRDDWIGQARALADRA